MLTTTGVVGASITGVEGSGSDYIVTVGTGTGSGTIRLDVRSDGTIKDEVGNALSDSFTTGETYTVEKVVGPAAVTLTTSAASIQPGQRLALAATLAQVGMRGADRHLLPRRRAVADGAARR